MCYKTFMSSVNRVFIFSHQFIFNMNLLHTGFRLLSAERTLVPLSISVSPENEQVKGCHTILQT